MKDLGARAYARLGRRGLFMLLLGAVQVIYGAGLLAAAGTRPARLHWWPGSVSEPGGLPLGAWGILWCAIGGLCLSAAWTTADRIGYAAAVLLNTGWAALAVQRWLATGEAGAWAPAAIYTGIAVGVFLVSGWPEPVPPPDLPVLPPPPTPGQVAALTRIADAAEPPAEPPDEPPP